MPRPTLIPARAGAEAVALPRRTLYRTLRSWLRPPLTRFFPLLVEGLGHLPRHGPYIIAANHHNYLDGVVLGLAVPEPVAFIVMPRVYRATPFHPPFHDRIGSIPINLERPDVGGLRRALRALERGAIIEYPRGAVQSARSARARAARGRTPRPAGAGGRGARGHPGNLRGTARPSLLSSATAPGHRALRRPAALSHGGRTSPPGARGRRPAHHGRHRRPAGSLGSMNRASPRPAIGKWASPPGPRALGRSHSHRPGARFPS